MKKHLLIIALIFSASTGFAQVKFSELPATPNLTDDTKFIVLQGTGTGANKTTPATQLTAYLAGAFVPVARTVNGRALSGDVVLGIGDLTGLQGALDGKAATAGTLAQFGSTSSVQLAGVISNETGTGALVFGTAPTISGATITSSTVNGVTLSGSGSLGINAAGDVTLSNGVRLQYDAAGDALRVCQPGSETMMNLFAATLYSNSLYTGDAHVTTINGFNIASAAGATLDTDTNLTSNSDMKVPSQKAVKAALSGKVGGSTGSTDRSILLASGTGGGTLQGSLAKMTSDGVIELPQVSGGGTVSTNSARIYAKDVGGTAQLFGKNEAGAETQLTGAGGSSIATPNEAWLSDNGNDGTGAVGDPARPFITLQAALNAAGLVNTVVHVGMRAGNASYGGYYNDNYDSATPINLTFCGAGKVDGINITRTVGSEGLDKLSSLPGVETGGLSFTGANGQFAPDPLTAAGAGVPVNLWIVCWTTPGSLSVTSGTGGTGYNDEESTTAGGIGGNLVLTLGAINAGGIYCAAGGGGFAAYDGGPGGQLILRAVERIRTDSFAAYSGSGGYGASTPGGHGYLDATICDLGGVSTNYGMTSLEINGGGNDVGTLSLVHSRVTGSVSNLAAAFYGNNALGSAFTLSVDAAYDRGGNSTGW